ncbi:nitrate reductase delta subunit [Cytobacillus eiseniae]|uniref:Nitrate reductase delta subunit n=1 Tax=Cytobacillus eiseniae TaxID=762947 RepID=A0ABS4R9W1_9BACI|nr:nitrate reductase molybdenum cofactor assembly chaperone [Cytobacillus eiseniae]MBP2239686.1 nitrate reductase delta subunit [Cytobacillus eiseniae]
MRTEVAETLVVLARFLDYPDSQLVEECSDLKEYLKQHLSSKEMQEELFKRLEPLLKIELKELQELYVKTFDYEEKTGMYLTAQELGDSRRRGDALIRLQRLISDLGFERVGVELTDFIPMLMELLAVAPLTDDVEQLTRRLSFAIHRIYTHLPNNNPYYHVFDLLMSFVFKAPNEEEIARLVNEREEADLDELPYPMIYR